MKKNLLICALAVSSMAFANHNVDLSQVQQKVSVDRPEKVSSRGSFNWQDFSTLQKARKAQQADYDAIDWFDATGGFHIGVKEGFSFYPTYGIFIVPFLPEVEFWNLYGATNWSVNGTVKKEKSETFEMSLLPEGTYYGPSTADHLYIDEEEGTMYKIKGATYGTNGTFVFSALSYHSPLWDEEGNAMMTKCAMTCDAGYGTSSGRDLFCVEGGSSGDPYLDGCGVHLDSEDPTKTADTLGVIIDNIGLMKIDNIVIPIWYKTEDVTSISDYFPDDAEIRLALFPMDEEGIYFDDTIASTVITNKDFVAGVAGVDYGTLTAKFYEEDLWGEIVESPIYVNGSFYLQLTNFNESGCDFGIYEDLACPVTGTTVYQHNGKFSFRASENGNGGKYGQNLAISFDAYFPTLENDTTINELNATADEGYAFFGNDEEDMFIYLFSNVNYEDWEIEIAEEDSWLDVATASTEYWEDYNCLIVALSVEALPEDVESRDGQITIIADGAEQVFTVHQSANSPQAIDNVDFKNNGKTYDVLGRENNGDFKGIVIRNGKKFLR